MLERFRSGWSSFFHRDEQILGLALFRIVFAYCLWDDIAKTTSGNPFAVEGGFHAPYVDFIRPMSIDMLSFLTFLHYPLIALLGMGLFMRTSGAILLVAQGWIFFSDKLNFRNHPYIFMLLLLLLVLSPADEALSLRSMFRAVRAKGDYLNALLGGRYPFTYQRLMQLQFCIAYFYAGLHKVTEYWLSGRGFGEIVVRNFYESATWPRLVEWAQPTSVARWREVLANSDVLALLAIATVLLELALPLALFWRPTRYPAMAVGVLFHLAIAFSMNIWTFSVAMIGSYVLFVSPSAMHATASRLVRRPSTSSIREEASVVGERECVPR